MKRKINIKEFAEKLGVSTATVSRAFGSSGRISEKTRKIIIAEAARLGYRASIHARNLSSNRSETVGFFFPSHKNGEPDYFINEIILGLSETAMSMGRMLQIHPFLYPEDPNTEKLKDAILNGSMEGVIIRSGTKMARELVKTAHSAGVPYIIIGNMRGEEDCSVTYNIAHGAELAGSYLKRTGKQKPAYISGFSGRDNEEKKQGFMKGLGKELAAATVFVEGGSTFRHGALAFSSLRREYPEADSVLCANDVLAIGFIKAAEAEGVRVPEDIAVIGCDDIRLSRFYRPALTTINLNEYRLGREAVELLWQISENKNDKGGRRVECDLVVRDSA